MKNRFFARWLKNECVVDQTTRVSNLTIGKATERRGHAWHTHGQKSEGERKREGGDTEGNDVLSQHVSGGTASRCMY